MNCQPYSGGTKSDYIFVNHIKDIIVNGVWSENARPKYKNGQTANSKYITGIFDKYDLSNDDFPITQLRPIPVKSAIKELFWIYQDQSNDLSVLEDKYKVKYWRDWEVNNTNTIGQRYGATVKKHHIIENLLEGLEKNPWNRRNVINLWQYEDFKESDGLLPCAFMIMFDVRKINDEMYLDATLTQRSNDMLVAHHINAMQYVALQMMIAKHFGWKVGEFNYMIQNLHIYSNQFDNAKELINRYDNNFGIIYDNPKGITIFDNMKNKSSMPIDVDWSDIRVLKPKLILDVPDKTNFFDIKPEDFKLVDYNPIKPQLSFDLAI